jgi:sugar lactone lactonase YvrE
MTRTFRTLVPEGRYFEGPRWHAGCLWMVDSLARTLVSVGMDGHAETISKIEGISGGMGILPDGDAIVTSMFDRTLQRYRGRKLVGSIQLSAAAAGTIDDMIVDAKGRIYVGDLGIDLLDPRRTPDAANHKGRILRVDAAGRAKTVAEGLSFPNGIAVSGDGKTLVVAESDGDCLSSFAIAADGSLSTHKRFGSFGEPDGVCMDCEKAVWVSLFKEDAFVRVDLDGRELDRISTTGRRAVACVLGGPERRTLLGITADTSHEDLMRGKSHANVIAVDVVVAGAGSP